VSFIDLDTPRPVVAPRATRPRRWVLLVAGLLLAGLAGEPGGRDAPTVEPMSEAHPEYIETVIVCDPVPGADGPRRVVLMDEINGALIQEFDCPR
jgi:hypothetical protein